MIEKVLALSSSHLPSRLLFGLTIDESNSPRYVKHKHGWIVFVDTDVICSDWFKPIMERAIKEECTLILFDDDAPSVEDFKQYDR